MWFTEALSGKIGRITPAGVVTEFALPPDTQPYGITVGSDGNLWFAEQFFGAGAQTGAMGRIGRITTAGVITEFSAGISSFYHPFGITAGPDGNLWFTEEQSNPRAIGRVGRITTSGVITEFSTGQNNEPNLITAGPDGNLWFGEFGNDPQAPGSIGRITPSGVVTQFGGIQDQVFGITAGPDGNLWFTEPAHFTIGRITPSGVITEVARTSAGAAPEDITTGPDGNLWFVEAGRDRIGRITTAGALTEFDATSPNSPPHWAIPVGIAVGRDNNIWYTEVAGDRIGRLDLGQAVATTTTTLSTSTTTAVVGQSVLLTANVTSQAGMPTGTVLFKDGNTQLGFAQVDANGQATLPVSLGAGSHSLTAEFVSNTFPGSTSTATTVTVDRAATTVALASSLNPVVTGQAVTFTATAAVVAPGAGTPNGTITFKDGTVILGTVAVDAGGVARFTTSFTAAGGHAITAVYNTDPSFAGSSQSLTEQVNALSSVPTSFDFGTGTSPVASGFTGVSPATVFSAAQGYGWLSGTIDSRDRGTGTDLNRDFNFTTDGTFAVNLANGNYNVTITMGDASFPHDQMGVFLQGTQVDSVTTAAGSVATHTYSVTVSNGQLILHLKDLGGNDPNAVINGLTISSMPPSSSVPTQFDF